jgi:hypothetical protein
MGTQVTVRNIPILHYMEDKKKEAPSSLWQEA